MGTIGFLDHPTVTPEGQALFDEDVSEDGYVMNVSRLWAYNPTLVTSLFDLMRHSISEHELSFRQRGIVVAASASTPGDSYCSVAWGSKLAGVSDPELAAGVLRGDDDGLTEQERALASWARMVARTRTAQRMKTSTSSVRLASPTSRYSRSRCSRRCGWRSRQSMMRSASGLTRRFALLRLPRSSAPFGTAGHRCLGHRKPVGRRKAASPSSPPRSPAGREYRGDFRSPCS